MAVLPEPELCYRALRTRDARFDGRFFTGVRSTGVFCRPVCPAKTPRRENCTFFASAAAAAGAGFRPCLRCRPEVAPGTPAWAGTHATVARALRLIEDGALDDGGVDDLARRLGVGPRHLRRLFLQHLGATPVAVAQTRRVLFAKRLIDETALPMTQVAAGAGFGSLRRFNDAMRRAWGRPPSALRQGPRPADAAGGLRLRLAYRPPLAWPGLRAYLAARATPGVEEVAGDAWRRTLAHAGARGWVEVRAEPAAHRLEARVVLDRPVNLASLAGRLRRLFDLGADPEAIAAHLAADPRLAPRVAARPGVRVPGSLDGFELAVRAILGQQVSVAGATTLAGRLAARLGEPLAPADGTPAAAPPTGLARRFPTPERVAAVAPVELAARERGGIGLPAARAHAIVALARAVAEGRLALDGAEDPEAARARLAALPGIGAWTAAYVSLRALGDPDAFPASDLGLRRALAEDGRAPSAARLAHLAEPWRPWRGYAAMWLWQTPPP